MIHPDNDVLTRRPARIDGNGLHRCVQHDERAGIDSVSSFLSRAFSSSSPFSLRASDTSMPLYFDRHVQNVASLIQCLRQRWMPTRPPDAP